MSLVRPLALAVAALLLTSFALAPQVNAAAGVRTLLELGVKVDVSDPKGDTAGDVDQPLPKVVHEGETHFVHGKLSIINAKGVKIPDGVPNANVKLIDIFNAPSTPIVLASGTTDEKGFFVIEWLVEAKNIHEELPMKVKEGIGSLDEARLTVMAVYDGDDTYTAATSLGYAIELQPLTLKTSIVTDKPFYAVGDVAKVTVTFRNLKNELIDPDSLSVIFNSMPVSAERIETGTYSFLIHSLTEGLHMVSVLPETEGYVTEAVVVTVTVSPKVDFEVDIKTSLDQDSYGLGDFATLSGIVSPPLLEKPILLSVTNPNRVVFSVAQIFADDRGVFDYSFELEGHLAVPGKWSVSITYLGKQIVKEFSVGEMRTKFMKVSLGSVETVDELGDAAERGETGRPIGIEARLTNTEDRVISLAYIVKVTDSEGFTAMVSWIKIGNLMAGESMRPAIFWIPEEPGEYTIDIFLWDDLASPVPLSAPAKMDLSVV